ncbi:3-oxo-5-alpha-steroid 4-dehydrogenase [Thalassoglobus neptunius]|uniref:3-oxo-5-alpha-steroid 4-dehydrogenase n=1 Tax=Thalassoglobus neptunius TaxID=1938619 RepID=A0A5C5WAP9_9PLAN|nr:DUF1295 domain-containing protein [Thalassoglobus neptunius]TWT47149.1 3-oxo-5-alpha-steroid 4-dehydrogenase [Thalassoglobus neptunius]
MWVNVLGGSAVGILILMLSTWGVSVVLRNTSIVDVIWGIGFAIVAFISLIITVPSDRTSVGDFFEWESPSRWLLVMLTTIWGSRLSLHLAVRNYGQPEDKRYAAMRANWGEGYWWKSLFIVFLLQGVVMWVVSLPLQAGIAHAQNGWKLFHWLGLVSWVIGFYFEAVGDWQLTRFRADPANKGKVLQHGLWRYTRHPNYFGDFCIWWGLFLIAVAHGEHLWTIISPVVMSYFLLKISGVTLLEKSLVREKSEYADYVQHTNVFFPGPRR